MLKKKMQTLAKENLLSGQNKFEVISDPSASQVLGGVAGCPVLTECTTYSGSCSNLVGCGTYHNQQ